MAECPSGNPLAKPSIKLFVKCVGYFDIFKWCNNRSTLMGVMIELNSQRVGLGHIVLFTLLIELELFWYMLGMLIEVDEPLERPPIAGCLR